MRADRDKRLVEFFTYHAPDPEQIADMQWIRGLALELARSIEEKCPNSAERSTAIRKLREAVMWANASIVLNSHSEEK